MRSLLPAPAWVHDFVRASFGAASDLPHAAEQLQALQSAGRDSCPRCKSELDLEGYRRTETSFVTEEVLRCPACRQELLLSREERA